MARNDGLGRGPGRGGVALAASALAALAGGAVLVVEFAFVRLAAPWFGQSEHVWANAVGVILLALALGQVAGGRVADRGGGAAATSLALTLAALFAAASGLLGPATAAALAPFDVGGDRPLPLSFWGSLAATAALAAPAAFALGAVPPLLVHGLSRHTRAGAAAGLVSATGTLGCVVGCVATPLLAIPMLGTRRTLLCAAAVLALAALVVALRRRGLGTPDDGQPGASDDAPVGKRVGTKDGEGPRLPEDGPGPAEPGATGTRVASTLALAAVLGLGTTAVEFASARALAPRFGLSNPVWATQVAVVLAGLAVGAVVGGRWVGTLAGLARTRLLLFVAAGWLALAGTLSGPIARGVAAALGNPGPVLGAAVAAAVAFGPPLVALGAAGPAFVHALASRGRVGRAAGAVYGAGTLGALAGSYAAPLFLLPTFGVRATILLGAAALLLAAVALCRSASPRAHAAPAGARA